MYQPAPPPVPLAVTVTPPAVRAAAVPSVQTDPAPPPLSVAAANSTGSVRRSPNTAISDPVVLPATDVPSMRNSRRSSTIHGGMTNMPQNMLPPSVVDPLRESGGGSTRDSASRRRKTGTAKKAHNVDDGLEGVFVDVVCV